jgi:CBS domain-containing protein
MEPLRTCGDIMTANPTTCVPTQTVEHVAQLMRDEDVGSIPVVAEEGSKRLVGIITDRDLVLQVLAEGRSGQDVKVEQVMTRDPVTCREIDTMHNALNIMTNHQVRRVPVVNTQGDLVGIIAQADVAIRVDKSEKTAEVVEEISRPDAARRY